MADGLNVTARALTSDAVLMDGHNVGHYKFLFSSCFENLAGTVFLSLR